MLTVESTESHFRLSVEQFSIVAQLAMLLGVVCNVIAGVSFTFSACILGLVRIIVDISYGATQGPPGAGHILGQIPKDIRTTLKRFDLDGRTVTYAVCPQCHCTYKPHFRRRSDEPEYPSTCSNFVAPGSDVCGAELLVTKQIRNKTRSVPIKTFVYHDFKDYLAGLLSRADLERAMDDSCLAFVENVQKRNSTAPDTINDIFDGDFMRSFRAADQKTLFVNGVGRYVFSFNVDFFNVQEMRIRGAATSCGVISMICLNLPTDIRHKPENMYVAGIIPGPKEPRLTELNHYLRPLVDDLMDAWERGIGLTRTALYESGRTVYCAIGPVVCDLPAARKVAGMAGHTSHHYCTICTCEGKETLGRTDVENWVRRDRHQIREWAEEWKNAPSVSSREKIKYDDGVLWSELWRLPYWDPTRQLVVDPMHCLLEGVVQNHFRYVLKLSMTSAIARVSPPNLFRLVFKHDEKTPAKDIAQVGVIGNLLSVSLDAHVDRTESVEQNEDTCIKALGDKLFSKTLKPLQYVCSELHLLEEGHTLKRKKAIYVRLLETWVSIAMLCGISTLTCYHSDGSNRCSLIAGRRNMRRRRL